MESSVHFTKRLNDAGFRYMVTGSVAAAIYGELRNTNDVEFIKAYRDEWFQWVIGIHSVDLK